MIRNGRHLFRIPWIILSHSGDTIVVGTILVVTWIFCPAPWKERSLVFAAGVIFTGILVTAVKYSVRKRRPPGEDGRIYRITDPYSFPSGHAARCFMLAVVTFFFNEPFLAAGLSLWAILVTASRWYLRLHYLRDLVTGVLLGMATGIITGLLQSYLDFLVEHPGN